MNPASSVFTWFAVILSLLMTDSRAVVHTVTNTADSGPGSLRLAILDAGTNDTPNTAVCGTISLTTGSLSIINPLVINGPGARRLVVQRALPPPDARIIDVTGGPATITGITISNGKGVQ